MNTLSCPMPTLAGCDDEAVIVSGGGEPAEVGQDGPFDWYVPASAAEFTALGVAPPQHLHLMQDASATAADEIGDMPYTAANGPAFAQTIAEWDRDGISFDGTTSKQSLYASAGEGPDLSSESFAQLVYFDVQATSAAASKHYLLYGVADPDTDQVTLIAPANSTDTFTFRSENVNVGGVYDNEPSTVAVLLVYNRAAGTTKVYTSNGDKLVGTYVGSLNDGYKCIGSVPVASGTPPPATFTVMWSAMWVGADAEMDDADAKALFEAMNIDPIWYVAVDGPTHRFYPGAADQWAVLSAYSTSLLGRTWPEPEHAWLMQETSTPVLDKIGSIDLTVVFATMNASISISGYSRKCLSFSAGGSKGQAGMASGTGPDPITDDFTLVGSYTTIVATTVFRQVMMLAGTTTSNEASLNINTIANGSELQAKATTDAVDDASAFVAATPMRIYARWVASTKTLTIFTKDRKWSVTASGTVADGVKGFGGSIQNTPAFKLDHGHMHESALTDQQIYDQFTILERTAPSWSP